MSHSDHEFRSIVVFAGHGGSAVSYGPLVSPLIAAFTGSVFTTAPSVVSRSGDEAMGWWHGRADEADRLLERVPPSIRPRVIGPARGGVP